MSTADFLGAPLAEIKPLLAAAASGDAEAQAYFADLFPAERPCILCDRPAGPDRTAFAMPDPAAPALALLLPVCGDCRALPPAERARRELTIFRRMWPRFRWSPHKDNTPGYLRGGRVKVRR